MVACALGLNLFLGQILAYINSGEILPLSAIPEYFQRGWAIILQTIAMFYLVFFTIRYFNQKFAASPNAAGRFLQEIVVVSLAGFVVQEIFRLLFIRFSIVPENPATLNPKLRQLQMMSMTFLLVIYALVTSVRIFWYLQQKQLELVKWQREYTQSQFEALKNQLNPHFLFNSLSILTSLVYADADKAETFIAKLSRTYRYLLEQKDKEKIALSQELEFLHAYTFLIAQRFGNKLQVQIDVEEVALRKMVPPHALMIAMEYIVANNAMSAAKPLHIRLSSSKLYLDIAYSYQPKKQVENTSKEQLDALRERYNNLSGMPMFIEKGAHTNTIRYPLLPPDEN